MSDEDGRARVKINGGFTLAFIMACLGGGYLAGGTAGAAAGAMAAGMASILSYAGLIPLIGQVIYAWVMHEVKDFILQHVDLGLVWSIAWWIGFIESVILSILVVVALLIVIAERL